MKPVVANAMWTGARFAGHFAMVDWECETWNLWAPHFGFGHFGWATPTPSKPWAGLDMQFSGADQAVFFAWLIDGSKADQLWKLHQQPELISKRTRKTMTIAQGKNGWVQALDGRLHGDALQFLALGQEVPPHAYPRSKDAHIWRWTASGTYSALSSYMASFHGSLRGRHGRLGRGGSRIWP
jgi:hypothetical protein